VPIAFFPKAEALTPGFVKIVGHVHYSQVKLKALLSMSKITHLLPVYPIKI
jgi:hypothetical protein